jgi:hypothetical protein
MITSKDWQEHYDPTKAVYLPQGKGASKDSFSQSLATKVELPQKLPIYHHIGDLLQPGGLESSARAAGENLPEHNRNVQTSAYLSAYAGCQQILLLHSH